MSRPRPRVNWYLYALGVVVGLLGAWVAIGGLQNGRSATPIGWIAMIGAVYFIRRAYYGNSSSQDVHNGVSDNIDSQYFIFNKNGWSVIRLVMIVSLILSAVIFVMLLVLSKIFSDSYTAGSIGAYSFLAVGGIATLCGALELMRCVRGWLSK